MHLVNKPSLNIGKTECLFFLGFTFAMFNDNLFKIGHFSSSITYSYTQTHNVCTKYIYTINEMCIIIYIYHIIYI